MQKVRHIKTGKVCYVLDWNAIEANNANDGRKTVAYYGNSKETGELTLFFRNAEEFKEKFVIDNSI